MLVVEEVCLLLRRMRDSAVTMIRPGLYRRPFHNHDWIEKVGLNTSFAMKGPRVSLRVSRLSRRVVKDSIRVPRKQILQLEQLVADRVDPTLCIRETAGRIHLNNTKLVDVTRPEQTMASAHRVVYCEYSDSASGKPDDVTY
jgi:hypothetical protein